LGEDGADRGGHHLGVAAGHLGEHIAQAASLIRSSTPADFIASSTSSKAAWSMAIVHRVFL
jgi:hypothetical protein